MLLEVLLHVDYYHVLIEENQCVQNHEITIIIAEDQVNSMRSFTVQSIGVKIWKEISHV